MTRDKKLEGPAQPLSAQQAARPSGREISRNTPLLDRISEPPPMPEELTAHNLPGFVIQKSSDDQTATALFQISRKLIDNHKTLAGYVASVMTLFQDVRECTVYVQPEEKDGTRTLLKHRITVWRDGETTGYDESEDYREDETDPILQVFRDRKPTIIDHELGAKLVFQNLDSNSGKGDIYPVEKNGTEGTVAIMPYYYRDPEEVEGVVVFKGPDLRARNSELEGCSRLFWGAHIAMAAASVIGFQDKHKFCPKTGLSTAADFKVDFSDGVKELMEGRISNIYLLIVDLDHFKIVNDVYGHDKGDEVLRRVAETIEASVRPSDKVSMPLKLQPSETVSRWGGEEYGVLVKDVDSREDALVIAERIRQSVAALRIDSPKGVIRVTCSIGITSVDGDGVDAYVGTRPSGLDQKSVIGEIYGRAFDASDFVLLQAKGAGRNRCMFAPTKL